MSSTWPLPLRMSISTFRTSMMSEVSPYVRDQTLGVLVGTGAEVLLVVQDARADDLLAADAAVELHAAHGRQVVALRVEEQVGEQVLRGVLRRRLAGTHHAVDLDQRLEARLGRIDAQRVRDVRTTIEVVRVQRVDLGDAGFDQLLDGGRRQHFVGLGDDLAGVGVHDIVRKDLAVRRIRAARAGA